MKHIIAILFLIGLQVGTIIGATYYVAVNDPASSDSNAGTEALPWKTITKANSTLVAGDIVYIKSGLYTAGIAPANNGTYANRIQYQNYGSDVVIITGTTTIGVLIDNRYYIYISGIMASNLEQFVRCGFGSNPGGRCNIITNCVFMHGSTGTRNGGCAFENSAQSNIVINCILHHWTADTMDFGDNEDAESDDFTWYNIIDGCTIYSAGHACVQFRAGYNILRNSWLHNEYWLPNDAGQRAGTSFGSSVGGPNYLGARNLIESNRISFGSPYVGHPRNSGWDGRNCSNVVRFNQFHNSTDGGYTLYTSYYEQTTHGNKIYHNAFFTNGIDSGDGFTFITSTGGIYSTNNSLVNNVFSKHANSIAYRSLAPEALQDVRSNWFDTFSAPQDPLFVDVTTAYDATTVGLPDLRVKAASPCVDKGAYLTTVTSASGTGTSIDVAEPYFFFAGHMYIPGDRIQLAGQTDTARITAISGNTLTIDTPLTYTTGQGISLPYSGSRPDIGINEFQGEDVTDPVISGLTTNAYSDSCVVTWNTDEAATSGLAWGLTSSYTQTVTNSTLETSHYLVATNLLQLTTYHFKVYSTDAVGNGTSSDDFTFDTIATPPLPPSNLRVIGNVKVQHMIGK